MPLPRKPVRVDGVLEHQDDIDLAGVLARFEVDLAERGVACEIPADPLHDEAFVQRLIDAYVRFPVGP